MNRLANKVALITGATSGIGLATAQLFKAEGAKLVLTGKNPENVAKLKAQFPEDLVLVSDAGNVADAKRLADAIASEVGKIDAAFLNAGIGKFAPLEAIDEAHFDELIDINLKGVLFTLQALIPVFNQGAAVVLNASIMASRGVANSIVYSITKAAVLQIAKNAASESALLAKSVRVNAISPGPITTPIYDKLGFPAEALAGFQSVLANRTPIKRFGEAEEIARVALFLASSESSYLVGSEIVADGGIHGTMM